MTLRAVCLDAAGTLFVERHGRAAIYADALRRRGWAGAEADVARWMAQAHAELLGAPGPRAYSDGWFLHFVSAIAARAGCAADPEVLRAELARTFADPASYRVYPDVEPSLQRIRAAGLRLAVVSNWSARLPDLLSRLGLARHFDVLIASEAAGAEKPHAAIFQHALEALGVPPAQALHVGDQRTNDLEGARRAGLGALLVDREGHEPRGPEVVASLLEVARRAGA